MSERSIGDQISGEILDKFLELAKKQAGELPEVQEQPQSGPTTPYDIYLIDYEVEEARSRAISDKREAEEAVRNLKKLQNKR